MMIAEVEMGGLQNPYKEAAQMRKALKLADYLDSFFDKRQISIKGRKEYLSVLPDMKVIWWEDVAHNAGVKKPSRQTQLKVCDILASRYDIDRESIF
jgi:hypothetical protein